MSQSRITFALCIALLATPALAATYQIDGTHSSAVYRVKHFDTSNFYGTFSGIEGTIRYDPENVDASSIEVTIVADSVNSRNERRDEHIKSPDFLNVKQFPTITFKSRSVKAKGDTLEIVGDLTLLGVTKKITVTAEKTGEGQHPRSGKDLIGFETRFSVDRTAHDMGFMVGPVSKNIDFILALEAAKQ